MEKIGYHISHEHSIDYVIAIGTGGWLLAKILRNNLPPKNGLPVTVYSIGILGYDKDNKLLKEPYVYQKLPPDLDLSDKVVLLIDEVTDTGRIYETGYNYVKSLKPKKLLTAVLHKKASSTFLPDYVGKYRNNRWIRYPWDKVRWKKAKTKQRI